MGPVEGDPEDEVVDGKTGEGAGGTDEHEVDAEEADDAAEQPDGEEDDGEQEVIDAAPPKQPGRAETRVQRLANEAKAARAEAAQVRTELAELRRSQQQTETKLTADQEAQRVALMTPEERSEYRLSQAEKRFGEQSRQLEMQMRLTADKSAFDAKATVNPVYARYKDDVESKFNELLAQGRPAEREVILKYLLGEKALNGGGAGQRKAQKAGARRVEAQRVAPTNSKGDAATQRGRQGNTAESRLKDMII